MPCNLGHIVRRSALSNDLPTSFSLANHSYPVAHHPSANSCCEWLCLKPSLMADGRERFFSQMMRCDQTPPSCPFSTFIDAPPYLAEQTCLTFPSDGASALPVPLDKAGSQAALIAVTTSDYASLRELKESGFTVLGGVLDREDAAEARELLALAYQRSEYGEEELQVRVGDIVRHHPVFAELMMHPRVLSIARRSHSPLPHFPRHIHSPAPGSSCMRRPPCNTTHKAWWRWSHSPGWMRASLKMPFSFLHTSSEDDGQLGVIAVTWGLAAGAPSGPPAPSTRAWRTQTWAGMSTTHTTTLGGTTPGPRRHWACRFGATLCILCYVQTARGDAPPIPSRSDDSLFFRFSGCSTTLRPTTAPRSSFHRPARVGPSPGGRPRPLLSPCGDPAADSSGQLSPACPCGVVASTALEPQRQASIGSLAAFARGCVFVPHAPHPPPHPTEGTCFSAGKDCIHGLEAPLGLEQPPLRARPDKSTVNPSPCISRKYM